MSSFLLQPDYLYINRSLNSVTVKPFIHLKTNSVSRTLYIVSRLSHPVRVNTSSTLVQSVNNSPITLPKLARHVIYIMFYLTNRFHVAVHLSSNRSQMTSKCGKNKKVAHEAIAEGVTNILTTFDALCHLLLDRCTATWNLFVLYNRELNFARIKAALFLVKRAKVGPSPFRQTRKKPFGVIYDLHKMTQSHWLLCVAKDCDWSRKITPLSNLT